jgi:hypothetical protein
MFLIIILYSISLKMLSKLDFNKYFVYGRDLGLKCLHFYVQLKLYCFVFMFLNVKLVIAVSCSRNMKLFRLL